jgi:hypothetical protein
MTVGNGDVLIAAITSCTNTSNPTVMVGAGLLARKAVARGLRVEPTVKTSLAPGSRAVTGYLEAAGLISSPSTIRAAWLCSRASWQTIPMVLSRRSSKDWTTSRVSPPRQTLPKSGTASFAGWLNRR